MEMWFEQGLSRCVHRCSLHAALVWKATRSVGLQGSSARGLRQPAPRLEELSHVQRVSWCVLCAETALHPA